MAEYGGELELQSTTSPLSLLVPVPNAVHGIGENQEKFLPNCDPEGVSSRAKYLQFLGKLMGVVACRDMNSIMPLDLPDLIWKELVSLHIGNEDLYTIDTNFQRSVRDFVWKVTNRFSEPRWHIRSQHFLRNLDELTFQDLYGNELRPFGSHLFVPPKRQGELEPGKFCFFLSFVPPSSREKLTYPCSVNLVGLKDLTLTWKNRGLFADLLDSLFLFQIRERVAEIRRGLFNSVPFRLVPLFNPDEFQSLVCGSPEVDLRLLQRRTKYGKGLTKDTKVVRYLWKVLSRFSSLERQQFLKFVWYV